MVWQPGATKALKRSLDIYYRDQERTARMDAMNARFVSPGDLVFDIGAHVGDRTASYRRLGAKVVTVEPQASMYRFLRLFFGRDPQIHLENAALGAEKGKTTLYINSANPTTSTAARAMVEAAPDAVAWADQVWDVETTVMVMTLDQLIAAHGRPDFVKIDVEGYEAKVLQGLSHPLPSLSFEFTTLQRDVAIDALDILERLGRYRFAYSLGESHAMAQNDWISATEMKDVIGTLPVEANSGDIYAQLAST